jgi:polysaccharide biosynthesis protein PslH
MKPPLLFLSQCLPYPPHSGVTNRNYNILLQLRKGFEVTLIAHSRVNHQRDAAARARAVEVLEAKGIRVAATAPIGAETSRLRRMWDHSRSCLTRRAYTHYEYRNPALTEQLRSVLRQTTPALVHMDSLDLHGWLGELPAVPITCTHHSIESELLALRAEQIRSPVLARYIRYQAARLEELERELCPRFGLNLMMSELDAARLRALAPAARTAVVPNGVDTDYVRPQKEVETIRGRVVFLGPSYMFPNRDAIDFFLEESWALVRQAHPAATLTLIGRTSEADRERFERVPGVRSVGYVDDVRPYLAEAECCIAPLRVGGGTRLKILDYWAMEKPVVSTSIGCEGLETADGDNIFIRDDGKSFAEAVSLVLSERGVRQAVGIAGRRIADERYSWNAIGRTLRKTYRELLASAMKAPGSGAARNKPESRSAPV